MQWRRRLGWSPGELDWRVAALFMVGSLLFALGSFPPYSQLVAPSIVGVTFFVGSIFFTSAGYSQFLQAINDRPGRAGLADRFRFWAWQPAQMAWWATGVQLIGTLFFNVNTFRAMSGGLSVQEANRLVWAPDFFGSVAFLVASHLTWLIVCTTIWCVQTDNSDWWIAALNYVGSIFFMVSAIGAFTLPTTDEPLNLTLVNLGTFVGAVCFFLGAYLLLPPASERAPA